MARQDSYEACNPSPELRLGKPKFISASQVREQLAADREVSGSKAAAEACQVSEEHLDDVIEGRRELCRSILQAMGLRRISH
jgi:hypothetical protein